MEISDTKAVEDKPIADKNFNHDQDADDSDVWQNMVEFLDEQNQVSSHSNAGDIVMDGPSGQERASPQVAIWPPMPISEGADKILATATLPVPAAPYRCGHSPCLATTPDLILAPAKGCRCKTFTTHPTPPLMPLRCLLRGCMCKVRVDTRN